MYKFCFSITNGRHQMNALTSLLFHFPLSMTHWISGTSYQVRNTNNGYCSFSTTILSCLFICHVRTSTRWISFGYMWGKVYFQFGRQFTAPLKRRQLLLRTRHIIWSQNGNETHRSMKYWAHNMPGAHKNKQILKRWKKYEDKTHFDPDILSDDLKCKLTGISICYFLVSRRFSTAYDWMFDV